MTRSDSTGGATSGGGSPVESNPEVPDPSVRNDLEVGARQKQQIEQIADSTEKSGRTTRRDSSGSDALGFPDALDGNLATSRTPGRKERPRGDWTRKQRRKMVDGYLRRLRSPTEKEAAFRELSSVDVALIPDLIEEVENPLPSQMYVLDLLVLHDNISRYSEKEKRFYYYLKGMGRIMFDDIAIGTTRWDRRGRKVRLRNFESGFPLGVVLRAGLLNRFRSRRYPAFDDRDLRNWWRGYYERVKEHL